jgi:hypothetical protein
LVLHIGLPKTGTTSIQRTLSARRWELARHGVSYPAGPGLVVPQFLHRAAAGDGRDARVARFRQDLDSELKKLPGDISTVILSAEQCSLHLQSPTQIEQLRAWLAPYFETIRVVVYLRRQDALAASLYAQMLRRGIIEAPALDTRREELAALYDYAGLLDKWAAVFGRDALVPRIFAPQTLPNGDVVQDFLSVCGLGTSLAEREKKADINPSMNVQGQALLLAVGRVLQQQRGKTQIRDDAWPRLAAMVTQLCPGRGWQPSRAEAACFMARYEAGNEAVRRTWFSDRRNLFDTDFSDLPEHPVSLDAESPIDTASALIMQALRDLTAAEAAPGEGDARAQRRAAREQRRQRESRA